MSHSPQTNPVQFPVVVLRHELPDGSFHFDWMFARENPPTTKLFTLRTCVRPDQCKINQIISVERIGDHRIVYLNYEGPISRNRGFVRKAAAGMFVDIHHSNHPLPINDPPQLHLNIIWNEQPNTHQQWVIDINSATAQLSKLIREAPPTNTPAAS